MDNMQKKIAGILLDIRRAALTLDSFDLTLKYDISFVGENGSLLESGMLSHSLDYAYGIAIDDEKLNKIFRLLAKWPALHAR